MNWQTVSEELTTIVSPEAHDLWIRPISCTRFSADIVELNGPDRFFCSWVQNNYKDSIQKALTKAGYGNATVLFSCSPEPKKTTRHTTPAENNRQLRLPNFPVMKQRVRNLNPRFIFDEFVVGKSNAVAHTACHALADGDTSYDGCLYINADTGLGKSHLTHAVAHHLLSHAPGIRFNYLTSKQLTAEMFTSIKNHTMEDFKRKYGSCDVLLMEDMQALTGKTKTQEEFGSLLDILLETGKTVILTGSKAPKEIDNLDPSLRSRLSSGLVTTILPPDMETRLGIINKKSQCYNLALSEEVKVFLAEKIQGDVRQIKSALIGLKAKAGIHGAPPDLDLVREVLDEIIDRQQQLTPELIRDFVASQFCVSLDKIQSKSRKKEITFPRQISMYLARKHTEKGLSDIGRAFNRDHSTVVHAVKKISETMVRNTSVRGQVDLLSQKLVKKYL